MQGHLLLSLNTRMHKHTHTHTQPTNKQTQNQKGQKKKKTLQKTTPQLQTLTTIHTEKQNQKWVGGGKSTSYPQMT